MADIKAFPYMAIVRFDLANKEFDSGFNRYYDAHIQELADKAGYSTAWRTREMRGRYNDGVMEQEYMQIYSLNDPALFKSFPQNPPPPVKESEPWRRDMGNWGRVFYRVLSLAEKDARAGSCWARIEYRISGADAVQRKFRAATAAHLKNMLEKLPGVHRIWQLQHAPHAGQIASDPAGHYMNLVELDAPENLFDPSLGEERMPLKAGQETVGRHFAQLLLKAEPQR